MNKNPVHEIPVPDFQFSIIIFYFVPGFSITDTNDKSSI